MFHAVFTFARHCLKPVAIGMIPVLLSPLAMNPLRAAESVVFAPHRAVYEITLLRAVAGSGVVDMSGRMVYELGGSSCEGYTQNMRFVTRMTNQDGADTINDLRTSSWEELAQRKLRFSTTQYQNDTVAEASQGDAGPAKGNGALGAELVKPAKKHVALPKDVYFPMQHASALIRAAKSGETILAAKLYDGSEKGEKYYVTTAVIGKKYEPGAIKNPAAFKEDGRLSGLASWPMSISYFEMGQEKLDSPPAYELSFRYYENGITTDLKIDYGEFAIKGELKDLVLHDSGKCPDGVP
jgi:EipB-like